MTLIERTSRPIRSFVLRQGKSSKSQRTARELYWPQYGIDLNDQMLDWQAIFKRDAKRVLEIGFGMGDSLISLAKDNPETDFLGIEVHPPGVGRALVQANALGLTNLKLLSLDAVVVLEQAIVDQSLDSVLLYFPDPWPKTKHHKRRIVQSSFAELVAQKLKPQGTFQLATDWQPYAEHMLSVLEACPLLVNAFGQGSFAPQQYQRPLTKFENRGLKLGHNIWDLVYLRR